MTLPIHPVPDGALVTTGGALRVDGLVERPVELSQESVGLLRHAAIEEPFTCEEGWSVPGLHWGGVRLVDVLALARPLPAARFVRVCAGSYILPLALTEAESALLCDELNGEPLSLEHGAPWRLIVPGGKCFSSVKWVDRLELASDPGANTAESIARGRLPAR